ncbi:fibronectin type III domain-containing protein [Sphaerisporangium sp. NPDC049003]|uniref:fibronectin type III domain-containing protein n=1 Tax=Sphaerisporangium sp. NPDC049003 TaxID=3364517 RepID=UPI0037181032
MKDMIARNYPGTKVALTEYSFGAIELSRPPATDNVAVTGYEVGQRSAAGTTEFTTTATTLTVTGLSPGRSYTFWVRARDGAGNFSPKSRTVSVTTSHR